MDVLKLIARMPQWWHYGWADMVIYPMLRYVLRYRLKVVRENLTLSFPEHSKAETEALVNRFYHHLSDVLVEIVYGYGLTREQMAERMVVKGGEEACRLIEQYGSAIIMASHIANWEWQAEIQRAVEPIGGMEANIYRRQNNAMADRLMQRIRLQHGGELIEKQRVLRNMISDRQQGRKMLYGMLSDQKPRPEVTKYTNVFLHQKTGWLNGSEVLGRKFNYPILFFYVRKTGRGHYEAEIRPLCEKPADTQPGEVTERYARALEQNIREQPEIWLWTHNRWKWTRQ